MARSRYRVLQAHAPHFLTATIVNWIPIFWKSFALEILVQSLRFLVEKERIILYAYVIMPHHFHLIASAKDLSRELASLKSYTAHQILKACRLNNYQDLLTQFAGARTLFKTGQKHQVWQEEFHPILISNDQMMRDTIHYIHRNPVRAGLVQNPEEWLYSSAQDYRGEQGPIPVVTRW